MVTKSYCVMGQSLDGRAVITVAEFEPHRFLQPQLEAFAYAHGLNVAFGVVAFEAVGLGGPAGRGPSNL